MALIAAIKNKVRKHHWVYGRGGSCHCGGCAVSVRARQQPLMLSLNNTVNSVACKSSRGCPLELNISITYAAHQLVADADLHAAVLSCCAANCLQQHDGST